MEKVKPVVLVGEVPDTNRYPAAGTVSRVLKYIAYKGAILFLTLIVGLYITILVANLGGHMDRMIRGQIAEAVGARLFSGWLKDTEPAERNLIATETIRQMEEARGLNEPFLIRSGLTLLHSLILDFGSSSVRDSIVTALPYTVLLVVIINLLVFTVSISLSLVVSRFPGSLVDRLVTFLSPLTFAPAWVHGVILITVFAGWLTILPWPEDVSGLLTRQVLYQPEPFDLTAQRLKLMVLPGLAILMGTLFQSVYTWRSFFQAFQQEDYLEFAKAKGLSAAVIERRYMLRPLLPFVLTNYTILAVSLWQEAIALELLFGWPGVGLLFILSARSLNIAVLIGIVVVFAYLLAITSFVLDIAYALLDPRVKIGGDVKIAGLKPIRGKPGRWGRRQPAAQTQGSGAQPFQGFTAAQAVSALKSWLAQAGQNTKSFLRKLFQYPPAVIGSAGITVLVGIALYTVVNVPVDRAIEYWRGQSEDWHSSAWYRNPDNVPPAWVNWFSRQKLPPTIVLASSSAAAQTEETVLSEEMMQKDIVFSFDYPYDAAPSEITIFFRSDYQEKKPFAALTLFRPDQQEIDLGNVSLNPHTAFYLTTDERLQRKLNAFRPVNALFTDSAGGAEKILKGSYQLRIRLFLLEEDANVEVEAILYGQVHGMAGTDSRRRDPMLALLWGTVMALIFGLLGAIGTNLLSVTLAAVGAWVSGWIDGLILWISDVNLIVPKILVAILVSVLYSKSIWMVLGVLILLNIFGSSIRSYRALFLQMKGSPYLEAAQAYGASSWRIIWHYLLPRVLPVMVPTMMIMVPGYIFYEATLTFLGVQDPQLPTWGKIIYDALESNALLYGHWYRVVIPIGLLGLTGLIFTMFGRGLEQVLSPNHQAR